jgi:hypothetical protein
MLSAQPFPFLLVLCHILLHFRAMMEVVTDDGVDIGQIEHVEVFGDLFHGLTLPPRRYDRV